MLLLKQFQATKFESGHRIGDDLHALRVEKIAPVCVCVFLLFSAVRTSRAEQSVSRAKVAGRRRSRRRRRGRENQSKRLAGQLATGRCRFGGGGGEDVVVAANNFSLAPAPSWLPLLFAAEREEKCLRAASELTADLCIFGLNFFTHTRAPALSFFLSSCLGLRIQPPDRSSILRGVELSAASRADSLLYRAFLGPLDIRGLKNACLGKSALAASTNASR